MSGDIAVLMDYSLESGSGASDLTWLVPLTVFGDLGALQCNYGTVDPASHDLFAGGPDPSSGYSITVTKNETVGNIAAAGTITILNPTGGAGNPIEDDITAVILSLEDVIDQGGTLKGATVDCGVSYPHTLNAGDTLVCTCTASPTAALAGVNTATVTIEGLVGTSEYSGTADLAFTENTIGVDEISVDDTNDGGDFGPVITTTT